jgi:hypothetical protein
VADGSGTVNSFVSKSIRNLFSIAGNGAVNNSGTGWTTVLYYPWTASATGYVVVTSNANVYGNNGIICYTRLNVNGTVPGAPPHAQMYGSPVGFGYSALSQIAQANIPSGSNTVTLELAESGAGGTCNISASDAYIQITEYAP